MSKRLIRIAGGKLPEQLPRLLKQEIHCVLNNGKTYLGILRSFADSHLILEDARNHEHKLEIAALYEVVIDANSIPVN